MIPVNKGMFLKPVHHKGSCWVGGSACPSSVRALRGPPRRCPADAQSEAAAAKLVLRTAVGPGTGAVEIQLRGLPHLPMHRMARRHPPEIPLYICM